MHATSKQWKRVKQTQNNMRNVSKVPTVSNIPTQKKEEKKQSSAPRERGPPPPPTSWLRVQPCLFLPRVPKSTTMEEIETVLAMAGLGKVTSMRQAVKGKGPYKMLFIDLESWTNTIAVEEFRKSLQNGKCARIFFKNGESWECFENTNQLTTTMITPTITPRTTTITPTIMTIAITEEQKADVPKMEETDMLNKRIISDLLFENHRLKMLNAELAFVLGRSTFPTKSSVVVPCGNGSIKIITQEFMTTLEHQIAMDKVA